MRILKKLIVIFLVGVLLGAFSETNASDEKIITQNVNSISSTEEKESNKIESSYKEGEVIITYEKSFFNSTLKLSMGSFFDKYTVDGTAEFEDIQIGSDKTISLSNNDSKDSTLAISLVQSDKYTTEELINIFKDKDWIISVEPNYIVKTTALTNDTYEKYQWALENIGQNSGEKNSDINPIATSSENEKVIAVIDTGVDYTHQDLKNVMWVNPYSRNELKGTYGYDFANDDDNPMDDNGHGTHVAGIIAAEANNDTGITGAVLDANNIKIMALKTMYSGGNLSDVYKIIEAYNYIYKAQKLGTNIVAINNSWGGFVEAEALKNSPFFRSLLSVINIVGKNGALSVCASGNEGVELDENGQAYMDLYIEDENGEYVLDEDGNRMIKENVLTQQYPAGLNSDYIICVAASTENDSLLAYSNYGKAIDIVAPGTDILSASWDKYKRGRFLPSIYSDETIENVCKEFYNFENTTIEKIPFTVNVGKLSISDEKSFGLGKKSLKWEFDSDEIEYAAILNFGKLTNEMARSTYMIYADTECDIETFLTPFWKPDADGNYSWMGRRRRGFL